MKTNLFPVAFFALILSASSAMAQQWNPYSNYGSWSYSPYAQTLPPPAQVPYFPPQHFTAPGPGFMDTPHSWVNDAYRTGALGNYGGLYPNYNPGPLRQYLFTFGFGF